MTGLLVGVQRQEAQPLPMRHAVTAVRLRRRYEHFYPAGNLLTASPHTSQYDRKPPHVTGPNQAKVKWRSQEFALGNCNWATCRTHPSTFANDFESRADVDILAGQRLVCIFSH